MARTALFVFHPDRGHFNFCLPLATRLARHGVRCELWTHKACLPWTPEGFFAEVRTDFGESNVVPLLGAYKALVSHGDTDADGQRYVFENGMEKLIEINKHFPMVPESEGEQFAERAPVSKRGAEAFKKRLLDSDVGFVIFEGIWGKWARGVCLDLGKKFHGFNPFYGRPFRAAYCSDPLPSFDGKCILRSRPEDVDDFYGWPAEEASYIVADCLVGEATECGGRRRFGAFLPDAGAAVGDADLQSWLDGADLPEEEQAVTLIALGSQSALASLGPSAEADLLRGALASSPRVLIASQALPEDAALEEAARLGRLRSAPFVPQWAVLNHRHVRCFVSHAGANSVHEALAAGKAVVPLPFFSDQHYMAMRLEELLGYPAAASAAGGAGYVPLRKAALRAGGAAAVERVAAAVRLGLGVPAATLSALRESVVGEDGAGTAARAIAAQMGLA